MLELLLSWKAIPLLIAAVWGYRIIKQAIDEHRVRKLGGFAPRYKAWAPFGSDFIYKTLQHAFTDDNLKWWHRFFMTYGNSNNPYTIEASGGGQRIIFTADPENIKAVLATQFNDFGKGEKFNQDWHEFLGDSIFSTDGQKWQDSRQLIRQQFIKDRVSDLNCFEEHVSVLLPLLGGKGQAVDVKDLFFRYTLDAATDFLLGRSVDSLTEPSDFAGAFGEVQYWQSLIARSGPFNFLIPRKRFRQKLAILNTFVQTFIDDTLALSPAELEKKTKSDTGYTFLHALAGYTRDPVVLRDQLVAVLLAGRDTTACTLSWLFYELGRNPDMVVDLRREIEQTVGWDNAPTYADLKNMKLLQNTMNETLRLYPVVPFNVRVCLRDTTLPHGSGPDGNQPVGVLKNTPIGYSTHYMQSTPEIYPTVSEDFPPPHLFRPHRWEKWQPRTWTYIPFNGGPRLCVGQQFALTEMAYTVVRVLQRYSKVESRADNSPSGSAGLSEKNEDHGLSGGFQGKGGAQSATNKKSWLRRGNEASLVEKVVQSRHQMMSEIVLQPRGKLEVAFYE